MATRFASVAAYNDDLVRRGEQVDILAYLHAVSAIDGKLDLSFATELYELVQRDDYLVSNVGHQVVGAFDGAVLLEQRSAPRVR